MSDDEFELKSQVRALRARLAVVEAEQDRDDEVVRLQARLAAVEALCDDPRNFDGIWREWVRAALRGEGDRRAAGHEGVTSIDDLAEHLGYGELPLRGEGDSNGV